MPTVPYASKLSSFVDGSWLGGTGRATRDVCNPATGEILGALPVATTADLDLALESSARGFEVWRKLSPWDRSTILLRAAALLSERKAKLAPLLTQDNGKPLADSLAEIDRTIETIIWCAEEGKRTYGRVMAPRAANLHHSTFKRPVGPVAAFSPWNFPAVLMTRKVAAALAAGCSIIVKPAEESPAICMEIVRAFSEAGVPPGVLNLVFGDPGHISAHLISSPVIRKVSFTGSVPVGKLLSRLASDGLKAVTMELGGHSPVVVFDDVDAEKTAIACAQFKYRNAGQVCLSPNRIFVQEGVYPQFLAKFVEVAKNLKVGNGLDAGVQMGPLSNARRLEASTRFLDDAVSTGAKVSAGGSRIGAQGYFFQPTVLTDVDPSASIMTDEPFCPIAPIVPFRTFDEAVERANAVDYGLAAYAFTSSISRASAISEAFDAGWIGVNSFTPALADAAIGGTKLSGVGYEGGPEGLDSYLHQKFLAQADPL